ncbi:MBG domain-containing protein [Aureibacter tunicatorum]|nr:MBG domain-containing protein [Aureibacter tunicatorum]
MILFLFAFDLQAQIRLETVRQEQSLRFEIGESTEISSSRMQAGTITVIPEFTSYEKIWGYEDPVYNCSFTISDGRAGTMQIGRDQSNQGIGTYSVDMFPQAFIDLVNSEGLTVVFTAPVLTIKVNNIINIIAHPKTKIFGDSDPPFTYDVINNPPLVNISGNILSVDGGLLNVGEHPIVLGVNSSPNYNINYSGANLTVLKRPITISAIPKTKIFGDSDPLRDFAITPALPSNLSITGQLGRESGENVGIYQITLPSDPSLDNYDITFVTADFTILKRPLTIRAHEQEKIFGDPDPTLTFDVINLAPIDNLTGSTLPREIGEDVGEYKILPPSISFDNYDLTFVEANLTIKKRSVTITADYIEKVYGEVDPDRTFTVSPDLPQGLEITGSLSRVAGEDIGDYDITLPNGLDNYDITFVGNTFRILKRTLTITAHEQEKIYWEPDPVLTFDVDNLAPRDNLTGSSLTREAGEDIGEYKILPPNIAFDNYDLIFIGADLTIKKRPITITADYLEKTYGEIDPEKTYTITPSLPAGLTITGALGRNSGEDAGTYDITMTTGVGLDNYDITYNGNILKINKKALTITADDHSKAFGAVDPLLTYQVSGLVSGDNMLGSLTRVAGEDVGAYAINQGTLAVDKPNNYDLAFTSGTFTIAPSSVEVVVTANAKSKTYGDADPMLDYTVAGLQAGDKLTGSLARIAGEDVGSYQIEQGSLMVDASSSNINYTIRYVGADLTINKKSLTITADDQSKVFDATDPLLTYQVSGLVPGDNILGELTRVAGEDVGTYTINQGTLAVDKPNNYDLAFTSGTFTIAPSSVEVVVTANAKSKTYGDADPMLDYTVAGLQAGDKLTGSLARIAGEDVGSYQIEQGSLAIDAGSSNINYTIRYVGADLTINKKSLTITADDQSKVFDATDPLLTYQVSGLVPGDNILGELTRVAGEDVGTYTINQGTLAVDKPNNYDLAFTSGTFTIAPSSVEVVVTANAKSKIYGDADPMLDYTVAGLQAGDNLTGSLARVAGEDVGAYQIEQGSLVINAGSSNINYTIKYVGADLTINKKSLMITADDQSKTFGAADPLLTYQVLDLIAGDNMLGSLIRETGEDVGTYAVNQGTLAVDKPNNYDITFTSGTFTIAPSSVEVVVTAHAKSKTYGDADPVLDYTVAGLQAGDNLTGSLARVAGEDVGSYQIEQGSLAIDAGSSNINYTIRFVGADLIINKKSLTITAEDQSKAFGSADPVLTYQISGLVAGDNMLGSLIRETGEDVGTYAVNQGTLAVDKPNNYDITFTSGTFTIAPSSVEVVVTANAKSKTYGDTDPMLNYTVAGLQAGDNLTGSLARVAGEDVGSYQIEQGSLAIDAESSNTNYTIRYVGADLTINKRALTITADDQSKAFGAADPVLTYQVSGLVAGDNMLGSLTRETGEDVGAYAINQGTLAVDKPNNYDLVFTSGTFTIAPSSIEVVVTANVKSKTYGDADPELDYTVAGLQAGDNLTGSLARVAGEDVGSYQIEQGSLVVDASSSNINYTIRYVGADLTINKRVLTITADDQSKVFGAADPVLTYQVSGLVSGDDMLGSLTRELGEDVGSYAINQGTLAVDKPNNYDLAFTSGTFTIAPSSVEVVVTANAKSKIYGDADPMLDYTVAGLQAGDNLTGSLVRVAGEDVGSYQIEQGSLMVDASSSNINYTIRFVGADLTINKRVLTITADDQSKLFGAADPVLTYQVLGLVSGDDMLGSLTRELGEDVGTYTINQGTLALDKPNNYDLVFTSGTFTIAPSSVEVVVTAYAKSKTYGDADPVLDYTVAGLQAGDNLRGSLVRAAGEDVGVYQIEQGSLVVDALSSNINYTIRYVGADLVINKKALTITTNDQSKAFGSADPVLTYQVSGLVAGDNMLGSLTRELGEDVGAYAINQGTLAVNKPNNYELSFSPANLVISKRILYVRAENQTKEYGMKEPILRFVLSGVDEELPQSGELIREIGESVGVYKIHQGTLSFGSNYQIEFETGIFEILPVQVEIEIYNTSRSVGIENPPFDFEFLTPLSLEQKEVIESRIKLYSEANRSSDPGDYDILVKELFIDEYEIIANIGMLTIVPDLDIPELLTPNADGFNDTWNILGVEFFEKIKVKVFSQDGTLVFVSENYQSDNEWNGAEAIPGVYAYVIETSLGKKYNGTLIIRK